MSDLPRVSQATLSAPPPAPEDTDVPVLPSTRLPRLSVPQASDEALFAGSDLVMLGPIARGGMGAVMLGQQRSLGREVALKVMRPDRYDTNHAALLLREARVTGSLEHPNIIPVHALGLDEHGLPVMVMKRVDGVTLRELLGDDGHEGWGWLFRTTGATDRLSAAIKVLIDVAGAVEFAHSRGVLHRDIKPDNILIGRAGEVYLADWGVAQRVGADPPSHGPAGTPAYMAPEMASADQPLTPAADVYLLGATLHELLTGKRRHEAKTSQAALELARRSIPHSYDDDVPAELAALCNAATSPDISRRPASAEAFREALLAYLRHAASTRIADEAFRRLAAAKAIEESDHAASSGSRQALQQDLIESRFAFGQALREWPDNARAREGLDACQRALASFELARGQIDAARAIVRKLSTPDPALQARIDEAEAAARGNRAREEALVALSREHDIARGARERLALVALMFSGTFVQIVAHLPRLPRNERLNHADMMRAVLVNLTIMAVVTVVARRALLGSAINRRIVSMFFTGYGLIAIHRLISMANGQALAPMLAGDALLLAAVVAVGASDLGVVGRIAPLPMLIAAGVLGSRVDMPAVAYAFATLTMLGLLLVAATRARRPSASSA